jgi:integrase
MATRDPAWHSRELAMTAFAGGQKRAVKAPVTLADVLAGVDRNSLIPAIRRRDLRSAVARVARLVGDEPGQIPLDLPAIGRVLVAATPATAGLSAKTIANIRSDFLAAMKESGLKSVAAPAKRQMTSRWRKLMAGRTAPKRIQYGLSRFARYCSARDIEPERVNDTVLEEFIKFVREQTLHRKPNALHRNVARIWNEAVEKSPLRLPCLLIPSFRRPPKRVDWSLLPRSLRNDLERYLDWSAGNDVFAADARPRALAPQTIELKRNHVHAAITALIESGVSPKAIRSLRDLVTIEHFKRILRRRHEVVGGRENTFNHDNAKTLTELAGRWVKVDASALDELKRLAGKVPAPLPGLTSKNKATLRQFDDPDNFQRLIGLPDRLWAEVKRDKKPSFRTVLIAQAALAVGMLTYMPIRPQNLWSLKFDEHIFLRAGYGAISSLELPAAQVKNRTEMAFDIPAHLAKMLIEYRDRLVPKVIGKRPVRLFIKEDGTAKSQWAVGWLIRTVVRRRIGLQISPHQFRHLSAKVILDAAPGNFETARQLLGHKSLHTTTSAYTGISSRRAARHHQQLIEQTLATQQSKRRR